MEKVSQSIIQYIHLLLLLLPLGHQNLAFCCRTAFLQEPHGLFQVNKLKPKVCKSHEFIVTWKKSSICRYATLHLSNSWFLFIYFELYSVLRLMFLHCWPLGTHNWIIQSPPCTASTTRCHSTLTQVAVQI